MVPTAAEAVPITITVRVYQRAELRPGFGQRAQAVAETALRSARVNTVWKVCTDLNPAPACDAPLEAREVVLRVAGEGPQSEPLSLGTALVIPASGGLLATVYSARVARVAKQARTDVAVLLGRVAAHEIGHLIMNTSGHSSHGLMRAAWTAREVRRNRPSDWVFTAADSASMHQGSADGADASCR